MNEHLGPDQEPDETHLTLLLDSLATPPSRLSAPREAIFRKAARLRRRRAVASALAAAAAVAVVALAPSAFLTHRSPTPLGSPPVSSATVASPVPTPTPTPTPTPIATPTPTPTLTRTCQDPAAGDKQISLTRDDGVVVSGELYGSGMRGVVLGHGVGAGADVCEWYPYVKRLVHLGYVVLAVDAPGFGLSVGIPDDSLELNFLAGASELRRRGVTAIVLGGSSLGADGALVAAAARPPGVVGVFALSPSTSYHVDVLAAARQLKVPTLFVAAKDDLGYAEESRGLAAATPKLLSTLTLVLGMQHGDVMLLDQTGAPMPAAGAVEHLLTVAFAH